MFISWQPLTPGVQETWEIAQHAETDVDQGVGGADAALDPDGEGWEEDGNQAEKQVSRAHL